MTGLEKTEQELLEWLLSENGQEFLVSQGLSFGVVN
jgi:hypothetical protein